MHSLKLGDGRKPARRQIAYCRLLPCAILSLMTSGSTGHGAAPISRPDDFGESARTLKHATEISHTQIQL